ncbi:FAD-binding oxidoreductase [Nocardioides ultimimeridianus]
MTNLLLPSDEGFDAARSAWNLCFDHRPAAVVPARSVSDVIEAVRLAREKGWSVTVQATGHGMAVAADASSLLLDVSGMDDFTIDPDRRAATVGGGTQWGPVLAAAQEHGLAPLLGSAPHVGAVGYSLGGGFGWLGRRHGLGVDRVRRMTVVLADATVVEASPDQNPDLYWALLGGGTGSLGVVVELETELLPVGQVCAGNLLYPIEAAAEVFDFFLDWTRTVGEDMTSAFNITAFPPLEMIPPPLCGQRFAIVRGCHCGDPAEAEALVDLWRRWRAPAMDMFGPLPFAEMAHISNDPLDRVPAAVTGRWLREADRTTYELRHAGGAISTPNASVSYAARGAEFSLEAVAITPVPEAEHAARELFATMTTAVAGQTPPLAAYLNFVEAEERVALARQAFDETTWERLAATKRAVDPDGMFSHGLPL